MNVNFTVFIDKILSGEKKPKIHKTPNGGYFLAPIGGGGFMLGYTKDEDLMKNWNETLTEVK